MSTPTTRPYQTGDHVLADGTPGRIWYITARPGNDHGTAYVNLDAPNEHGNTTTVVILTADLTASMYQHRTLVLVRPDDSPVPAPTNPSGGAVTSTPAPSDDTTPALVQLDQDDAAARVLKTSLAWHAADPEDLTALRETFWAMKDAIAEYAAVTQ